MKNETREYNGIEYSSPKVALLQHTGIGVPEIAARTCYDSFNNSGNNLVKDFPIAIESLFLDEDDYNWLGYAKNLNNIDDSGLLHDLAWTHHHHSILEHTNLSFYIEGTSRGVLQEHSRHRIQAISVRSTRYTMSDILYAYISAYTVDMSYEFFVDKILELDMFVTNEPAYNIIQADTIWDKLRYHTNKIGIEEFMNLCLTKENIQNVLDHKGTEQELFEKLQVGKKKRNAGDSFKHIVDDNWKVDLVCTFNLRSLSNYLKLRSSGAAWFQINWLAEKMIEATPVKYLKLIDKKYKDL